jgi:hypothetical protein
MGRKRDGSEIWTDNGLNACGKEQRCRGIFLFLRLCKNSALSSHALNIINK